jgi:hypothetical protein
LLRLRFRGDDELGMQLCAGLEVLPSTHQDAFEVRDVQEVDEEARLLGKQKGLDPSAVPADGQPAGRFKAGEERRLAEHEVRLVEDVLVRGGGNDVRFVFKLLGDEFVRFVQRDGCEYQQRADRHRDCPTDECTEKTRREELAEESHGPPRGRPGSSAPPDPSQSPGRP